ncbi:hypothetical protein SAMN05421771_3489 [Granulicella pectinivorans]|uniref:Uncharacterized protein n=1 Tax=Granulicella pectinivorans TaxID=474950 RepID=A0A1I6MSB1_9BACT|nr:hypothetical protein [Granulicella pectinivorans]SFS18524.1 hypothetical protein SAMN05421771_3489 [Granulicella pectinivorans]
MFKRRWKYFGKLESDDGAELTIRHRSVTYTDKRGSFQFAYEDGYIFPNVFQAAGNPIKLTEDEEKSMLERVIDGLRTDGVQVDLHPGKQGVNP